MKITVCVSLLLLVCAALPVHAQNDPGGKYPWQEYDKLVNAKGAITAHGPTLFGDSVNLSNGALSFSATDVSVPGNGNLPVAIARTYAVTSRSVGKVEDQPFADWELDTPRISGVFAPNWPEKRCSVSSIDEARPPAITDGASHFNPEDYWHGNQASLPGGGEMLLADQGSPRPTTGGPYYWMTSGFTYFSCLGSLKNGAGEGFLAVTADGTKYWFDWMAQYQEPDLISKAPSTQWGTGPDPRFPRLKNVIYATRVEDRFGNWVTYTYENAWNKPAHLTRIDSSDQRTISVEHNAHGNISRIVDGGRAWTYEYDYTDPSTPTLVAVVLPDQSRWRIDFAALTLAGIGYEEPQHSTDVVRSCLSPGLLTGESLVGATGTITHPSGAVGTFFVKPKRHGRSNVPQVCGNYQSPTNDPNDDVAYYPVAYDSLSLVTKQVTGLGLTSMTWHYAYDSTLSWAAGTGPTCTTGDCGAPKCLSDDCAGTAVTTVTQPNGDWARHTFGNSYRYNEGKLLKVEQGASETSILKTVVTSYNLALSGQPYLNPIGISPQPRGDGFTSEYHRPERSTVTTQDGATFTTSVASTCNGNNTLCFDQFARPLVVTKSSSLGPSRTDATAYHDNLSKWILGQVATVTTTSVTPHVVQSRTDYDTTSALPIRKYGPGTGTAPGKLQQTLTYNADGTLATVSDGRDGVGGAETTVTLSNWKRGIPQLITHPATPESPNGSTESAAVNDDGTLAWVMDEAGSKTCYGYDAMGRLNRITYPSETQAGVCDTSAWNPTTISLTNGHGGVYGVPAGHWRQTTLTGNGRKVLVLDALWRPIVEQSLDLGNVSGTVSEVIKRYDVAGRMIFQSYPMSTNGQANYADTTLKGTHTWHDSLDRVIRVEQDSELGRLATTTEYLSGFKTRVTNPRQKQTITSYFSFGQPSYDAPAVIDHPQGTRTAITRDPFGKPTELTRSGPDS